MALADRSKEPNRKLVYHAAPGRVEGTWMVIAQDHPRDIGRGIASGLPNRSTAEKAAERLNSEV